MDSPNVPESASGRARSSPSKKRTKGLARTDADYGLSGARVPLAQQVSACVSRWQQQLPAHGAVSLAEMHRYVPTSAADTGGLQRPRF